MMFIRRWTPLGEPNGKTALLIHGLASSSTTWFPLARYLTEMGYEVVAPDLTGHGHSPRCDSYSVNDWTDDIVQLGITPDLIIGHSIGGLIAANLNRVFSAADTVLLDPVFHLPRSRALVKLIQFWFAQYVLSSRPPRSPSRYQLIEHKSIRQWDAKSITALSSPRAIADIFLQNATGALMIRANRSYVFPRMKFPREGFYFEDYADSGHNIHHDNFPRFTDSLMRYVASPSISSTESAVA